MPRPLGEISLWFVVPLFVIAIFMLEAMMQCTLALVMGKPRQWKQHATADELRAKLLALTTPGQPWRIEPGTDCDLRLVWDALDAEWRAQWRTVKLSVIYDARLLLDEVRHELRINEHVRTANTFVGFTGWSLVASWRWSASWGIVEGSWAGVAYGMRHTRWPRVGDAVPYVVSSSAETKAIAKVARQAHWTVRPVFWPFQATRHGLALFRRVMPDRLEVAPSRRFWSIAYPASFAAFALYLLLLIGVPDVHNTLVLLLIFGVWWGIWCPLAWALCGFPRFWQRADPSPGV